MGHVGMSMNFNSLLIANLPFVHTVGDVDSVSVSHCIGLADLDLLCR